MTRFIGVMILLAGCGSGSSGTADLATPSDDMANVVTADMTILAIQDLATPDLARPDLETPTFSVTPSGDTNTNIAPSSVQTVNSGSMQAFTVTAALGYVVSTTVGGTCPAGSFMGSVYTTGAIVGNCTVTFTSSIPPPWAETDTSGAFTSAFNAVAIDSNGNVYAVGTIGGNGTYGFGNSVTATGGFSNGNNIVLVKYNSSGIAQWAQTVSSAAFTSTFNSVAVDSGGNIYAAGMVGNNSTYGFGNSITTSGGFSNGNNILLVKYNSSGVAQWAQTVSSASFTSSFNSVAVDTNGNIYAAGAVGNNSTYGFGNSITTSGGFSNGNNILLVKYNSLGVAQWADTVGSATFTSVFNSIAVDGNGNIYAGGAVGNNTTYGFGNSVTTSGGFSNGNNILLVKYSSSGIAQWADTVSSASFTSVFNSVALDSSGNIYAAGAVGNNTTYGFGNSVTTSGGFSNGNNILLVKYNSSGVAQWADTVASASFTSVFNSVVLDSGGNIYAAGAVGNNSTYGFGNSVTVAGAFSNGNNVLLVKYSSAGVAQSAQTVSTGSTVSSFSSVAIDSAGVAYTAGTINGNGTYTFATGITANGAFSNGANAVLVKY